jgi:RNA polymerase sigma-70 factor (ECF subfamily)
MIRKTTRPSLLLRVRDVSNRAAWREFDDRYGALILHYCRTCGLQHSDAEDVRQIVMLALMRSLPRFEYSPERGRFRSYLGRIVRNAVFQHNRRLVRAVTALDNRVLDEGSHAHQDETDERWEREWVAHHYRLAMRRIRATFEPRSVEAFFLLLQGRLATDVAAELNMTEQGVHKIKQRIRDRLRELIARQIRDEEQLYEV